MQDSSDRADFLRGKLAASESQSFVALIPPVNHAALSPHGLSHECFTTVASKVVRHTTPNKALIRTAGRRFLVVESLIHGGRIARRSASRCAHPSRSLRTVISSIVSRIRASRFSRRRGRGIYSSALASSAICAMRSAAWWAALMVSRIVTSDSRRHGTGHPASRTIACWWHAALVSSS